MKGMFVINQDIIEAAQRKKRKIHEENLASAADLEGARKAFEEAQDKVVQLRGKNVEMKRHHRRGEENYFSAEEIWRNASIQVAEGSTNGTEPDHMDKLRAIATLSTAILKSATVELERLTRKLRYTDRNLQVAHDLAEEKVLVFEDHKRRQDQASRILQVEEPLMNAVTNFLEREN